MQAPCFRRCGYMREAADETQLQEARPKPAWTRMPLNMATLLRGTYLVVPARWSPRESKRRRPDSNRKIKDLQIGQRGCPSACVSASPFAFRAMVPSPEPMLRAIFSNLQQPPFWVGNAELYATTAILFKAGYPCDITSERRLWKRPPRKSYYVEFWHGGSFRRFSTRTPKQPLAVKIARRLYDQAVAARFAIATGNRYPIEELLDKYLRLRQADGLAKRTLIRAAGDSECDHPSERPLC